jgi:hypothetical protein
MLSNSSTPAIRAAQSGADVPSPRPTAVVEVTLMTKGTRHHWTIAALAALAASGATADKPDTITATVVALDAQSHTITLQGDDGKVKNIPVEGDALTEFDLLEPGKTVNATFRDNPAGHRQAITHLDVFKTVHVFAGE